MILFKAMDIENRICEYPKFNNNKIIFYSKIFLRSLMFFSFFFIYIIIFSNCLEFISNNGNNFLATITNLTNTNMQFNVHKITIDYRFAVIYLCIFLFADIILFHIEQNTFLFKHKIFYKQIKNFFNFSVQTDILNIQDIAEKYINQYIEDIFFGLYESINKLTYLISSFISIYLLIIVFHIIAIVSNQNGHNISDIFINYFNSISLIGFVCILTTYFTPGYFFYSYYNIIIKNYKKYTNIVKENIQHRLSNKISLNFNHKEIVDKNFIKNFMNEIKVLKKYCNLSILFILMFLIQIKGSNNKVITNTCAFTLIFPLFLNYSSIFLDKIILPEEKIYKELNTIVKIEILHNLPLIKENHNTEPIVDFKGLEICCNNKTMFNFNNLSINNRNYIINTKQNEKILIINCPMSQDHIFDKNIINLHYNLENTKVSIKHLGGKIDITKANMQNMHRLQYLDNNFQFLKNISVLENFQRIIPSIKESKINYFLQKAFIKEYTASSIYLEHFNDSLKLQFITALMFAMSEYNDLIIINFCVNEKILKILDNLPCSIICFIDNDHYNNSYSKYFNSIFKINNYEIKAVEQFLNEE